MSRAGRTRADQLLVERGLVPSRERGRALILAGQVFCGEQRIDKAGHALAADADLRLAVPDHPFVGRGGLKLEAALDHFGVDPAGRVILDVGASTGGFTDCLLRRGARFSHAVDVGHNQLDWRLRNDPRVRSLEGTHIRDLEPAALEPAPDLAVVDVSFIGLAKVIPHLARFATLGAAIVLVKPNFELEPARVGKGGVVRDPEACREAVERVRAAAREHGFTPSEAIESPIRGGKGNREFLLHLRRAFGAPRCDGGAAAASDSTTDDGNDEVNDGGA
ncbi:MAG: TlyA family RNA methyltransferase [Deltaproteobacteria bacterium]|jgi:23S rRNA (cytidine1920-2'-O)/16S rRNA (cytidine1409-2'-O)-methyltransferase|nr:TlyA family RNA methyltransferase [Deltaproteobacteria bacterium]